MDCRRSDRTRCHWSPRQAQIRLFLFNVQHITCCFYPPRPAAAAAAASGDATSKVLGIIESVSRATAADIVKSNADITAAMAILQGLPLINIELWSKLARAAKAANSWGYAFECAQARAGRCLRSLSALL